jgi:hypothetical protein
VLQDFPTQAGRKADEPFVVFYQKLVVDAGLEVEPLGVRDGVELIRLW